MLALSLVFYNQVKVGYVKVEDIPFKQVKEEVEELLRRDKEKEGK